jgi:hypothetical protein
MATVLGNVSPRLRGGFSRLARDRIVPIAASHRKSELTFIFELGKRQRTFEDHASTFGLAVSGAAQADDHRCPLPGSLILLFWMLASGNSLVVVYRQSNTMKAVC